jgi:hypothetical protein
LNIFQAKGSWNLYILIHLELKISIYITKQNSRIVYGWYVDSKEMQQKEGRYKKNFHCFKHTGHIKRSQRVADVTIAIRDLIKEHAKHNIAIGSITSLIYARFKMFVSDAQIRWDLCKLDINVSAGRIQMNPGMKGPMSQSQTFVDSLLEDPDISATFLFENLTTRERIRENGMASGTYVQIENLQNEKWFMRIANGNVIDAHGDNPALESALWCKPNSVVLCAHSEYPRQKCEIKTIMAAGPYSKFKKMLEIK